MPRSTNEETWDCVISTVPEILDKDHRQADEVYDRAWDQVEKLMKSNIKQVDIFTIGTLMKAAYDAGKADAQSE